MAPCASCGEETNKSWIGCMGMLKYTDEEGEYVYCSPKCQATHRLDQEQLCRAREQRKTLFRIATLCRSVTLSYLECAFDRDYRSIKQKNRCLYIQEGPILNRHIPFPSQITANEEHRLAMLTFRQCNLAVSLPSTFVKQLLRDYGFSVNVLNVHDVAPKFWVIVQHAPGSNMLEQETGTVHTVLLATTENGEQWIIDSVGCQYGFQEILVPLAKYVTEKTYNGEGKVQFSSFADYHETWEFGQVSGATWHLHPEIGEDFKLERPAREHFAKLRKDKAQEQGDNFSKEMLSGSDEKFEETVAHLNQEVKARMTKYVKETYNKQGCARPN